MIEQMTSLFQSSRTGLVSEERLQQITAAFAQQIQHLQSQASLRPGLDEGHLKALLAGAVESALRQQQATMRIRRALVTATSGPPQRPVVEEPSSVPRAPVRAVSAETAILCDEGNAAARETSVFDRRVSESPEPRRPEPSVPAAGQGSCARHPSLRSSEQRAQKHRTEVEDVAQSVDEVPPSVE